ncbi:MAG: hypothetical protein IJL88_10060 [Clostridia bacterium]|nr:hypothetical protein [Clostridia bacterium]
MAMWTSVSVFVEAESVEDINRVVNEIDLLEYLNGTTCQKRKISDGKRSQNDNRELPG